MKVKKIVVEVNWEGKRENDKRYSHKIENIRKTTCFSAKGSGKFI